MKNYTLILIGLLCLPFSAQAVVWSGTAGQNIIPLATNDGQAIVTHSTSLGGFSQQTSTIPQQTIKPEAGEMITANPGMETISNEYWIDWHATSGRWNRKKRSRVSSANNGSLLFKSPIINLPHSFSAPQAKLFSGQGIANAGGTTYFVQSLATEKFTVSAWIATPIHNAIRIQIIDLTTQAVITQKTFQDNATWTLILEECFVGNIDDPTLNTDDDLVIVRERTAANGNIVKQHLVYNILTGTLVRAFSTASVPHAPTPYINMSF